MRRKRAAAPVNQFINVAVAEKAAALRDRRLLQGEGSAGRPGGIRPHPGQGRVGAAAPGRRGPRGRRAAVIVVWPGYPRVSATKRRSTHEPRSELQKPHPGLHQPYLARQDAGRGCGGGPGAAGTAQGPPGRPLSGVGCPPAGPVAGRTARCLLFVVEEESDPKRFSIHRLAHYCLDLGELFNPTGWSRS